MGWMGWMGWMGRRDGWAEQVMVGVCLSQGEEREKGKPGGKMGEQQANGQREKQLRHNPQRRRLPLNVLTSQRLLTVLQLPSLPSSHRPIHRSLFLPQSSWLWFPHSPPRLASAHSSITHKWLHHLHTFLRGANRPWIHRQIDLCASHHAIIISRWTIPTLSQLAPPGLGPRPRSIFHIMDMRPLDMRLIRGFPHNLISSNIYDIYICISHNCNIDVHRW